MVTHQLYLLDNDIFTRGYLTRRRWGLAWVALSSIGAPTIFAKYVLQNAGNRYIYTFDWKEPLNLFSVYKYF